VRKAATEATREQVEPDLEATLVNLLSDQAAAVRRAAAKTLAGRGTAALKETFLQIANASNVGVRKAGARALGTFWVTMRPRR
jgi:HEAT repeat protein